MTVKKSFAETATADYMKCISEPVESEIIAGTEYVMDYLKALGFGEEQLSYIKTHRRRIWNTAQALAFAIGKREINTIADIGANIAFIPVWRRLCPKAEIIMGIDPEQGAYLRSKGEIVDVFSGDFEHDSLPIASESVDLVSLFEVFEHLYVDPMFLFVEINRILKPGGIFILTSPNSTSWRAVLAALTSYHPYLFGKFGGAGSRRHVHEPAPRDIAVLLEAAGFMPSISTVNNYSGAAPESILSFIESAGFPDRHVRGDTVIGVGFKGGSVKERYPQDLYIQMADM